MATFDGIVIGGGHNGLTCAAYLARAGLRIAVIERNPTIGGGCMTEEVTLPGFKHNLHANFHLNTDGPVITDLELHRYGLEYIFPDVQQGIAFDDGTGFCVHRDIDKTVASIARLNRADAERYRELHELFAVQGRDFFVRTLFSPPAALEELGGPIAEEVTGFAKLSAAEAVERTFEDERVRCLFKSFPFGTTPLDMPGLGGFLPRIISRLDRFAVPRGGSYALPLALGRVVEEAGGTLVTGAHVEEIVVKGGRAVGVRLAGGEAHTAERFVASGIDVGQTVALAGADLFGGELSAKVEGLAWSPHSLLTLHLALEAPPELAAAAFEPDLDRAYNTFFGVTTGQELAEMADGMGEGTLPARLHGNGACNTRFDPSYAPPGKHTAFWWPFAPYALDGDASTWDDPDRRAAVEADMLRQWRGFAPNLTDDNVLGTYLFTPLDVERTCITMQRGSYRGMADIPSQMEGNRPTPELSRFRTPVEGLYLCSSTSHPGGGVTCGPGYNAANAIADDMGVDRWWPRLPHPASGA